MVPACAGIVLVSFHGMNLCLKVPQLLSMCAFSSGWTAWFSLFWENPRSIDRVLLLIYDFPCFEKVHDPLIVCCCWYICFFLFPFSCIAGVTGVGCGVAPIEWLLAHRSTQKFYKNFWLLGLSFIAWHIVEFIRFHDLVPLSVLSNEYDLRWKTWYLRVQV